MIRGALRVVAIAAVVATVPGVRPAAAEPVNILGGTIYYSRQNQATFNLTLLDGWMRGEFGDNDSESWTPSHACFGCTPGSTIDPSVSESMPANEDISAGGVLNYRGVDYFISNLSFTIDSDPVTLPSSFNAESLALSSVAQFVLHGLVQGWTDNHFSGQGLSLLGYGKAQITVLPDGNWYATTFRFEDPAAVPEPGTFLLFGTGAVGGIMRWRKRRRVS
jgi:hypothetical protein